MGVAKVENPAEIRGPVRIPAVLAPRVSKTMGIPMVLDTRGAETLGIHTDPRLSAGFSTLDLPTLWDIWLDTEKFGRWPETSVTWRTIHQT